MARAHSIYLVDVAAHPIKAFTVKHECREWLRAHYPKATKNLTVWRLPDGMRREENATNVTAEIYKFV